MPWREDELEMTTIGGRYDISENIFHRGEYFIFDKLEQDFIDGEDGRIRMFDSIQSAKEYLERIRPKAVMSAKREIEVS